MLRYTPWYATLRYAIRYDMQHFYLLRYMVVDFQKNVFSMKTLKEIKKINEKIALLDNSLTEGTCTEASLHYDEYGSPGWLKNVLRIKPLKEIKKQYIKKLRLQRIEQRRK